MQCCISYASSTTHFAMVVVELKCINYIIRSKYIIDNTSTVVEEHVILTKFYVDYVFGISFNLRQFILGEKRFCTTSFLGENNLTSSFLFFTFVVTW